MAIVQNSKYPVTKIMLHTLAVPTGWYSGKTANDMVLAVRGWHTQRGWRCEGYHRIFAPNGSKAMGRSLYDTGAGCKGQNRGVIHLALCNIVAITAMGQFDDFYTPQQRTAVRDYILEVEELHGSQLEVVGHNQFSSKLCPGFMVESDEWS